MANSKEILEILKNEHNWSIKDFMKHFNVDEEQLYCDFLEIIEDEVCKLDFDFDVNRYKYLYKVFKYFDNLGNNEEINKISKRLKKIQANCNHRLKKAIKNGNENAIFDNVIYKIIDIIEVTLLKLEFNQTTDLLADNDQNSRNYKFLHELIYKVKNYDYVFEVFKSSYKLIYTTNPQGQSLIEELINHYIQIVKDNSNLFDVIYFEKVIKIFLDFKIVSLDKNYLQKLINKLLHSIDDLKREKIKRQEIERIKFFLNEIIKDLKQSNEKSEIEDINFKYNISEEFDEDILEEARNAIRIDNKKYIDLRRKYIITIDSPDTRMYDDACSFEKLKNGNYLLGIYVSDVDSLVTCNSNLDRIAYQRAESIYLPNHKITMFPEELTHRLSLYEQKSRLAIGHFFLFDSNMDFVSFQVRRTIISVKHNLDYYDVENSLAKSDDIYLYNVLKSMVIATERLSDKQIYSEQYETLKTIKRSIITTDENYKYNYKEHKERSIFSTFIILMNHYIANFFDEHKDIPFPYHVNLSKYDDYVIKDLKQKIYDNADFETILDCLNEIYIPSFYAVKNLGHNGLNLASYANASNPLRQYISLLTERLVKHHIIDKNDYPLFEIDEMKKICDDVNNQQRINFEYKKEFMKIKRGRKG